MYQMNGNYIIKCLGADNITAQLKPYVSERRQQRIETVLDNRLLSIQVALEMPADIHNAFAVIRSCEIFGVAKIHIIAPEKMVDGMRQISKGAMDWVDIAFYQDINDFLAEISKQNYLLAGAAPTASQSVGSMSIEKPLCLLLGNEHSGLSPIAQQACHCFYQIPMFGMTESFNLSVAAAISLYDMTARRRAFLQTNGDLTPLNRKMLQAHYYFNSVNARLTQALFGSSQQISDDARHRQ